MPRTCGGVLCRLPVCRLPNASPTHPSRSSYTALVQGGAAAAAALAQRCGLAPLGAAAGARPYAGSALEKLQEAAHKVRSAAATSAGALRAAGDSVSRAPGAIYRHLPTSAQQLVNAAQVGPGGAADCPALQPAV